MSDRDPSIWPRINLKSDLVPLIGVRNVCTSEPDEATQWQEGLIKQLTEGEPLKVREITTERFVEVPVGWHIWVRNGQRPSSLPVGYDRFPVLTEPTTGLPADGDSVPQGAGGHWVEVKCEWGAPTDGLGDYVEPVAVVPQPEGCDVQHADESGGDEPLGQHVHHVSRPKFKVGLRVGWLRFAHILSFLGFCRASVCRPADHIRISEKKDAA